MGAFYQHAVTANSYKLTAADNRGATTLFLGKGNRPSTLERKDGPHPSEGSFVLLSRKCCLLTVPSSRVKGRRKTPLLSLTR